MQEDQANSNLEDNLQLVTYIMLHRIYDMLTLIANKVVDGDEVSRLIDYHEKGYLLGPSPSYNPGEENDR
jgi:hypothetical protein